MRCAMNSKRGARCGPGLHLDPIPRPLFIEHFKEISLQLDNTALNACDDVTQHQPAPLIPTCQCLYVVGKTSQAKTVQIRGTTPI